MTNTADPVALPPPLDDREALAALDAFWQAPWPSYQGRIPTRIAGSSWDQDVPEGTQNPYWQIIRMMPVEGLLSSYRNPGYLYRPEIDQFYFSPQHPTRQLIDRHRLTTSFSWSIPSPSDIDWITRRLVGKGVVEVGAGGGYWAWQLEQAAVDIVAYDLRQAPHGFALRDWYDVLEDDASAAGKHPDRSLLLVWPSFDLPWAAHALACYRGDQLFYAGEEEGGCCADDAFFELRGAEFDEVSVAPEHFTFSGIHCRLTEYRRRAVPKAISLTEYRRTKEGRR